MKSPYLKPTLLAGLAMFAYSYAFAQPLSNPPVIYGDTTTLSYTENAGPVIIDPSPVITADGNNLKNAYVQISGNYKLQEDTLLFTGTTALTLTWNEVTGTLGISGTRSITEYLNVIKNIRFLNKSDHPSTAVREISFAVADKKQSAVFTKNIAIVAVNDAPWMYANNPLAAADTLFYTSIEDQPKTVCPGYFDPEGDPYFVSLGQPVMKSGTFTVNAATSCIAYTPRKDFFGQDFVPVFVCDAMDSSLCRTSILAWTVTGVNDPPVIVSAGYPADSIYVGTDLNTLVNICIETTDIEKDSVYISSLSPGLKLGSVSGLNGVCFDYTPLLDSVGSEYITVTVCDNGTVQECDTAVLRIEFPTVNTPPRFVLNGTPVDTLDYGVLVNGQLQASIELIDREKDVLTLDTAYLMAGSGSLSAQVTNKLDFTYSPVMGDSLTSATLSFIVCDNRNPSMCTELVATVAINYPPVLEDATHGVVDTLYLKTQQNIALDTCLRLTDLNSQSVFNSSITGTRQGAFSASVDNQNTKLCMNYQPPADTTGTEQFIINLCDNGSPSGCTDIYIVVQVFPPNTPPVIAGLDSAAYRLTYELNEDDTLSLCLQVTDAENDRAFVSAIQWSEGPGTLSATLDTGNFCFLYLPEKRAFGTYEAWVTLCDDNPFSLCQKVPLQITLNPINDPPVAQTDSVTLFSSDEIIVHVLANDADPENEGLYINRNHPLNAALGTAYFHTDSTLRYVPDPDEYRGTDTFTYSLCDQGIPQKCTEASVAVLFSLPVPDLQVYQAFSPNGDGINDVWFIDGIREFPNCTVRVTDQWNNTIYSATGYDNQATVWNGAKSGHSNGETVKEGTYFYIIDLGIGTEPLTGFVVIKR